MIDQAGIYSIPAAEYHRDPVVQPSLSASVAKVLIERSPLHAKACHPRLSVDYQRDEDSRMDLGSAAHALLLEQDGSNITFIAANDWRTNAAKEARDEARNAGKMPVLSRYEGVLHQMVKVARQAVADSELAGIFERGKPEQTLVWQAGGHTWCRSRFDWLTDDHSIILDYKSTESAEPGWFIRQIGRMGYDMQAAFYLSGMARQEEDNVKLVFLAQEIESPYSCSLVSLANSYLQIAEDKVYRAIETWRMCLASGKWPAYRLDIHWAEPSAWQLAEYEARLDSAGRTW